LVTTYPAAIVGPLSFSNWGIAAIAVLIYLSSWGFWHRFGQMMGRIAAAKRDPDFSIHPIGPRVREVLCRAKVIQQRPLPGLACATLNRLALPFGVAFPRPGACISDLYFYFAGAFALLVAVPSCAPVPGATRRAPPGHGQYGGLSGFVRNQAVSSPGAPRQRPGLSAAECDKFIQKQQVPVSDRSQEYCAWFGCMGAHDPGGREIVAAFARVLFFLGIGFGVLAGRPGSWGTTSSSSGLWNKTCKCLTGAW